MDPRWFESDEFLSYTNNFKMKMAVIFGIIQMSIGIILKGVNAIHFKQPLDFFFEFFPQILLLLVLFGWMDALIIGKWLMPKYADHNFEVGSTEFNQTQYSPPIITTMIDMFLAIGNNKNANGNEKYDYVFGPAQPIISTSFLVIALICVPMMLFVKPMVLKRRLQSHGHGVKKDHHNHSYEVDVDGKSFIKNEKYFQIMDILKKEGDSGSHGHSSTDIFIHQLIETIEFVLGTVSNTASYLRLWALSLAHSQLASVFLEQVLKMGFESRGTVTDTLIVSLFPI
jgi:V-type H+-transporting ATPase subunit a